MAGRASAFAVLGLKPGADAAAIERAYKRLIKQHHPDREGGDASRAAEINRAYRELRGGKASADPLEFNEDLDPSSRHRSWPLAVLFGGVLSAAAIFMGPSVPQSRNFPAARTELAEKRAKNILDGPEPMSRQLEISAIDSAVSQAVYLFRTKDEMALGSASRECQRNFRDNPGTALLDRCSAFDDAVVGLEDRDPLRDQGPFAPLAVTGRQWSAASALSEDDLAIDERLDRIRLRVEMLLAPQVPPVAPAENGSD
jgi:hypothetical protein